MNSSRDKRTKEWMIIVAVVIALHVVLFLTVRPSFFAMFKKSITSASEGGTREPFAPAAILTIPIEIEDNPEEQEQEPVQDATEPTPTEDKKPEETTTLLTNEVVSPDEGSPSDGPVDVENLLGDSPETLPHSAGPTGVMIPPRAMEITWPDTRKLKHCLGHHIDIKIEVDENGAILSVEPLPGDHPPDCIRAAVESARRIVFEPGLIDGVPKTMWTHIRIDFRKKK
jgi:outer membrane biosynthesis protein TonB